MCGPINATLDCQDALSVVDFSVPLPPGCTFQQRPAGTGDAFLGVHVPQHDPPHSLSKPALASRPGTYLSLDDPIGGVSYDHRHEYGIGTR